MLHFMLKDYICVGDSIQNVWQISDRRLLKIIINNIFVWNVDTDGAGQGSVIGSRYKAHILNV